LKISLALSLFRIERKQNLQRACVQMIDSMKIQGNIATCRQGSQRSLVQVLGWHPLSRPFDIDRRGGLD
jgi:hypothetical protein